MKWLLIFAVSALAGCAEVRIMDADFVANEVVIVNGEKFPLRSRADGYAVRKRFLGAEKLIFRNIRNCRFIDMWRIVDYKAPIGDEDVMRIGAIFYYYIVLSDGSSRLVKWYGRYSDHAYLAGPSSERCLDVKCSSFSGSFSESEVENSYLHLWCNFDETTGAEMLNIIEKYCAAGGATMTSTLCHTEFLLKLKTDVLGCPVFEKQPTMSFCATYAAVIKPKMI